MSGTVPRAVTFKISRDRVANRLSEAVDAVVPYAGEDIGTAFNQQLLIVVETSSRGLDVIVERGQSAVLRKDSIVWQRDN